ncbi:MAG TPA: TonB-dependent receptor [Caulobacteraceae bacterium]|jgi:iron complex outermembrane receptor protein
MGLSAYAAAAAIGLGASGAAAQAQLAGAAPQLSGITVNSAPPSQAYAAPPRYGAPIATLGPLGDVAVLDAPQSITTLPEDLIVDQQTHNANDTLRFLPSVEIRDQQGFQISRPQSRGFQSSIVQNTRLDGLNVIGTTEIPVENLAEIEVLNGPSGALYGPETPAGVFDYIQKRPTDTPLFRFIEGFQSAGIFTEQADMSDRVGPVGARLNVVHGEGPSYVDGSRIDRTLASLALDFHLDDKTVLEVDYSHYASVATGLPGSIVYDGSSTSKTNHSTFLPPAVDPTRLGYGQPGAGTDLHTDTGDIKIRHEINSDWSFELGGLYQNAIRGLYGISNTLIDDSGDYTVTKNFTAIPKFTIGSNSAYLNGHVRLFGMMNDISIGTNGFINDQYSYRNSITVTLGTSNLADPAVFPTKPTPPTGGYYESSRLTEQSIVAGDTLHFNSQWALQGVVNTSFLHSDSWNTSGALTASDNRNGVVSPTVSLIYKPLPSLSLHATYASSIEEGDQAPANTANQNQYLSPYSDKEYEIGAKYAITPQILVTLDAFHMTRPYATTSPTTNIFQVVGEQRNNGVELFAQGEVSPDFSLLGGVTYIDARLLGSDNPATNGGRIVGVPNVKTDVVFDLHPRFAHGGALTLAVNYEGNRAATDTNNSFAPAYVTLDPGVRYSFPYLTHHVTARFDVENVTGTRYYVSIADGNIVGSPGANTAYLGTPRTFMASLEFDF